MFESSSTQMQKVDSGRGRTCDLRFRRPAPYPFGHRATLSISTHPILSSIFQSTMLSLLLTRSFSRSWLLCSLRRLSSKRRPPEKIDRPPKNLSYPPMEWYFEMEARLMTHQRREEILKLRKLKVILSLFFDVYT